MDRSVQESIDAAMGRGDVEGMTRLGVRLLSGTEEPFDPAQGAALLRAAADRGGGEAAGRMAVLAAAGVCRPQSWEDALGYLQAAAQRGWGEAQAQLELLGGGVNLDYWMRPPERRVVSEAPRLRTIAGFLPERFCRWLIERARPSLARARVYAAADGRADIQQARTNTETDFHIMEADLVLLLVRARIAAATGFPPAVMELTKVLHYSVGERFEPHFDFLDPKAPGYGRELAERGQRIATFLLYLNDDFEGGETDFPRVDWRHKGRTGDALYFANVDPRGEPDPRTLHAGLAPSAGEKWLLSQWIRDRAPAGR